MFRRRMIVICLILLLLAACSVRKEAAVQTGAPAADVPTAQPTPDGARPSSAPAAETPALPVSGTDLVIPEELSPAASASLAALRDQIEASGCVCGLALLGHVSPELPLAESIVSFSLLEEHAYAAAFPFLAEITPAQCVDPAFSDLFCLVPGYGVSRIEICQMEMDEDGEQTDKTTAVLFDRAGTDPIFLSSSSNGWGGSNVRVRILAEDGSETLLVPAVLCNLGTISPVDGIYDFSLYYDSPSA